MEQTIIDVTTAKDMLNNAIDTHISCLYREADAYKRTSSKEAMMDCLQEINKYRALKKAINEPSGLIG